MEFAHIESWGPGTLVVLAVVLVLTDRLVWHTRLTKVEKQCHERVTEADRRRDEWMALALKLLGVADRMVGSTEQAVDIVDRKLPTADLMAAAILRATQPEPKGGGVSEVARMAAEAAAKRLRGE